MGKRRQNKQHTCGKHGGLVTHDKKCVPCCRPVLLHSLWRFDFTQNIKNNVDCLIIFGIVVLSTKKLQSKIWLTYQNKCFYSFKGTYFCFLSNRWVGFFFFCFCFFFLCVHWCITATDKLMLRQIALFKRFGSFDKVQRESEPDQMSVYLENIL